MKTLYVLSMHLIITAIIIMVFLSGLLFLINTGLDIFFKVQTIHTKVELTDINKFEIIRDF